MPRAREGMGPKPGSAKSVQANRKRIDANIRQIFEEEATQKNALRKAIQYMFENDPIVAVHAYLKLLSVKETASPINNVTNIFAEQINAPQLVAHMEDLARLAESAGNETFVQDEFVLPADSGSETH